MIQSFLLDLSISFSFIVKHFYKKLNIRTFTVKNKQKSLQVFLKLKSTTTSVMKGSLSRRLYVEFWLELKWKTPVSVCLIGVRLNGFTAVVQCYVHIPINLRNFMDSLLDTFGAPVSSHGSDCGIFYSLVKPFPLCECNLVLVPWTDDAQAPIKLLNIPIL